MRWVLLVVVVVALVGWGGFVWLLGDLPAVEELPERFVMPSVRVVDVHGRVLYDLVDNQYGRQLSLPLEDIPLVLQQATIATEDRNYYSNPGVDFWGIIRAFWINLRGREVLAGGSTITQQVARTLLLSDEERGERTVRRKLRESWLAWQVARTFSKDEILAVYLNQMYYGGWAYGVEAAAQTYFGKSATQLTLAESALLAGLPQAPALYNPFLYPEAAKARQEVVLGLMLQEGFITAEAHEQAVREVLQYTAVPYPIHAPHFVFMVQQQLDQLYTPEELYASGGLVVRTTLDLTWQEEADTAVRQQLERLNNPRDNRPSHQADTAALVALDPQTGAVRALVGSPDFFNDRIAGSINMAIQPRQPGSALKPLIYAVGLEPGHTPQFTPATLFYDVRTVFTTSKGESYVPVNFSRTENGPVLLRTALAASLNIPAVSALDQLGVDHTLSRLADFGVAPPGLPEDYDLSFALGGGEVTLFDLTRAYATLATGGWRIEPYLVEQVETMAGEVLYARSEDEYTAVRVLDPRTAWLISDMLSDDNARQLSFGRDSLLNIGRPAAVKTGTTNDFRDNWTVGYTPHLVVGVWVGNADQSPMRNATGLTGAAPIWHQFMRRVSDRARLPATPFAQPPGLVQREICRLSGLLPTPACPYTSPEWFIEGTEPTTPDTLWQAVTLDKLTGRLATPATPPNERESRLVLAVPAFAQPWARQAGYLLWQDVQTGVGTGGAMANSNATEAESPIRLVTPATGAVYQLSPQLPAVHQRIRLEAVGEVPFTAVTFYVNGTPLGTTESRPYEIWWQLALGRHEFTAVGLSADGTAYTSPVVTVTVNPPKEE
jgi:1A family penicillin-binding protein